MTSSTSTAKLDALTGLRYIAALTVLLAHTAHFLPADWTTTVFLLGHSAGIGMPLFFVLSGFLMTFNYFDAFTTDPRRTLKSFYVARFARIYPMYLIALLLFLSFMGAFFHDVINYPVDTARSLAHVLTLTQSWVHTRVFKHSQLPRTITQSYNPVSWSVSTEAFFYLLFPLIAVKLLPRLKTIPRILWAVLGVVSLYVALDWTQAIGLWERANTRIDFGYSHHRWVLYLSPYMRFGEFLVGCLTGRLFGLVAGSPPGALERRLARLVVWLAVLGILAFTMVPGLPYPYLSGIHANLKMNIGIAPLCAALIFCLARYPSRLRRVLGRPLPVLLGESSYCIYLLHPFVLSLFYPRLAGEGEMHDWWVILYNQLAMFLCLHILCIGFFQCIETPLRHKIRNLLDPHAEPRPTVFSTRDGLAQPCLAATR